MQLDIKLLSYFAITRCFFEFLKNQKIILAIVIPILNIDETVATNFFQIFSCWYLKLKFALNTFWTKIPKSNHCDWPILNLQNYQMEKLSLITSSIYSFILFFKAYLYCKSWPKNISKWWFFIIVTRKIDGIKSAYFESYSLRIKIQINQNLSKNTFEFWDF